MSSKITYDKVLIPHFMMRFDNSKFTNNLLVHLSSKKSSRVLRIGREFPSSDRGEQEGACRLTFVQIKHAPSSIVCSVKLNLFGAIIPLNRAGVGFLMAILWGDRIVFLL